MNTEAKSRLVKLLALAQRGIGGEAVNARKMLESALQRTGLTVDDLDDGKRSDQAWNFRGALERKLLGQILWTVLGNGGVVYKYRRGSKLGGEVTPEERVRIDLLWSAHRRALRKEVDLLFSAYIHAQRLFPKDAPEAEDRELTEDEQKRLERMAAMMMGIERVHVHLQLPNAGRTGPGARAAGDGYGAASGSANPKED